MFLNITIGVFIIGITILIHGYGTFFWVKLLVRKNKGKQKQNWNIKNVWFLIYTAIFLLTLNFIEAIIWGFTYYTLPGITEFESLEKAIYFSLVTFTTLGYGEITISSTNRILAGFEAMDGVLLLGWTTAIMFSVLQYTIKDILKTRTIYKMATENDSIPDNEEHVETDSSIKKEKKSPIKLITSIVLIVSLLFFIWYILSERHTPYTDQARIKGLVTPVTSRVSGNIIDIRIELHSNVKVGDTLFLIDPSPFEIAVLKAEANIDNATQSVAASSSSVKSAAGKLGVAKAQLERAQRNWDRVQKVMRDNAGALSESDKDQSETALLQATEQVASSEANLDRAKQSLGDSGPENPKIRGAIQDLEKAQLDLAFTAIIAPTDGVIESFDIDLGYYASPGQPLTTLISKTDVWIQADMKENNLSLMNVGDPVKYTFDIAPGDIFEGTIRSLGYGVATEQTNKGGLPSVNSKNAWLRDPQRFPVIISFDSKTLSQLPIRLGGQVDVVVYTGNSWILNGIASFRIKFNSWLSYAR